MIRIAKLKGTQPGTGSAAVAATATSAAIDAVPGDPWPTVTAKLHSELEPRNVRIGDKSVRIDPGDWSVHDADDTPLAVVKADDFDKLYDTIQEVRPDEVGR